MSIASLRLNALCLALILLSSGCSFYFLDGYGPLSRYRVEAFLPPESPARLAELKERVREEHVHLYPHFSSDHAYETRYVGRGNHDFYWPWLAGRSLLIEHYLPTEGYDLHGRPEFVWKARDAGFLAPFYQTHDDSGMYVLETGQCVARDAYFSLFYRLLFFHKSVKPVGRYWYANAPECVAGAVDLESLDYEHMRSVSIGWGLLAVGEKNDRHYVQIAWIPIPLPWQAVGEKK